jgi:hypothetical protein
MPAVRLPQVPGAPQRAAEPVPAQPVEPEPRGLHITRGDVLAGSIWAACLAGGAWAVLHQHG